MIRGSWDPAAITAVAAILGSLTGAMASSVSTWITQRHQDRRDLLGRRIFQYEQLYSEFINESARAILDAEQHTFEDPNRLIPTYALLSRIRLSSSTKIIDSAERVIKAILATYAEPNLTANEIWSKAAKRQDPLLEFSTTCRIELEAMQTQLR